MACILIGATSASQLQDHLASLELKLSPEELTVLSEASADPAQPRRLFLQALQRAVFGGISVEGWH